MVDSIRRAGGDVPETGTFDLGFGDDVQENKSDNIAAVDQMLSTGRKESALTKNRIDESGDARVSYSPPKRRKIDKDGFLTPATPEPHKFPFVNEDSSHNPGVLSENDVHFLDKQNKDNSKILPEIKEAEAVDIKETPTKPVGQLLQELGQEAKMLHSQWAEMFSQSENVEHFMLTRLNQIVTEAKSLESNLKQQKIQLKTRLQELLKTMETQN